MKKILLLMMSVSALTLKAQVYTEYFTVTDHQPDGTPGVALSPGDPIETGDAQDDVYYGWYLNPKSSNRVVGPDGQASPLVTSDDPLFYGDYKGSEKGQVVKIDSAVAYDSDQRSSDWAVNDRAGDTLKLGPQGSAIYTALLFKPMLQSKESTRDFFGYEWSTTTNSSRGRIFLIPSDNDVQFGVSKNTTSVSSGLDTSKTFTNGMEQTYLLVLKYEAGDPNVDADDSVRLFINPDPTKSEADQTGIRLTGTDGASDKSEGDIIRLMIRQRGINGLIGGIRVGTGWNEVLQGIAVTGVSLDSTSLTLDAGTTYTLNATVSPENADDPSVTWSSSDETVATVSDGVVTAVAEGTATITVTTNNGSLTAECEVTVNPATGVNNVEVLNNNIYPNPSNGSFTIEGSEGADILVFNVTGKVVYQKSNIANNEIIDANLTKGLYFVKVTKENYQKFTKLIIK